MEIEWLKEDTNWGYTTLGSKTIWNKKDGGAFEFLSRGQNSAGNKEVKYSFALNDVNATPSDPTATKFRLIFDANISGNHAEYDTIGEFTYHSSEAADLPAWTPTLEDPTVTGVNVLWWDEIYHLMVRYNIDKKGIENAADISSVAVLTDGSDTCTMGEVGGDGDIEVSKIGVNLPDYNYRPMMDSDTVNVTIYLTYELGGVTKTASFTFDDCPINKMAPTLTGAVHSSTQSGRTLDMEDYRIELNKPGGDPHSYNLEFIEVGIIWVLSGIPQTVIIVRQSGTPVMATTRLRATDLTPIRIRSISCRPIRTAHITAFGSMRSRKETTNSTRMTREST